MLLSCVLLCCFGRRSCGPFSFWRFRGVLLYFGAFFPFAAAAAFVFALGFRATAAAAAAARPHKLADVIVVVERVVVARFLTTSANILAPELDIIGGKGCVLR